MAKAQPEKNLRIKKPWFQNYKKTKLATFQPLLN